LRTEVPSGSSAPTRGDEVGADFGVNVMIFIGSRATVVM
jgi:hypothetical protein